MRTHQTIFIQVIFAFIFLVVPISYVAAEQVVSGSKSFIVTSVIDTAGNTVTYFSDTGTSWVPILVNVRDDAGVPIIGKKVTLTSDRGTADNIVESKPFSDESGRAQFLLRSTTSGLAVLTASIEGVRVAGDYPVYFYKPNFNVYISESSSELKALDKDTLVEINTAKADGIQHIQIKVAVKNADNLSLPARNVVLRSSRGGADQISTAKPTDINGVTNFFVSSNTPGQAIFVATMGNSNLLPTATITFTGEPVTTPAPVSTTRPDFVLRNLQRTISNSTSWVSLSLCNQGEAFAVGFPVLVTANGRSQFFNFSTLGLDPGQCSGAHAWPYVMWGMDPNKSYAITVVADPNSQVAESNEDNNTLTVTFAGSAPLLLPDLVIKDLQQSTSTTASGSWVSLNLCNQGTAASSNFPVRISANGQTQIFSFPTLTLAPDACSGPQTWQYTMWGMDSNQTYTVTAVADPDSQIVESNESNNTLTATLLAPTSAPAPAPVLPDLILKNLKRGIMSSVPGSWVSVELCNQGNTTPISFPLEIRSNGITQLFTFSGLIPGGCVPHSWQYETWGMDSVQTYTVVATADPYNQIFESNESNNTLTATLAGTVPMALPDLIVESVVFRQTDKTPWAVIKNQGSATLSAGNLFVAFDWYDAQNQRITSSSNVMVSRSDFGTLALGETATFLADVPPAGASKVIVTVNPAGANHRPETNETNNTFTATLPVAVSSPTPTPAPSSIFDATVSLSVSYIDGLTDMIGDVIHNSSVNVALPVYVNLRNATVQPLPNRRVVLTSSRPAFDNIVAVNNGMTDSMGRAIFYVTSNVAGTSILRASVNGQTLVKNFEASITNKATELKQNDKINFVNVDQTPPSSNTDSTTLSNQPVPSAVQSSPKSLPDISSNQPINQTGTLGQSNITSQSAVFIYGKLRLDAAAEQDKIDELRTTLKKYFGTLAFKRLFEQNVPAKSRWNVYVNAYIYGNYPVRAITQSIFVGKTVHLTIPWDQWKNSKDYQKYINKLR